MRSRLALPLAVVVVIVAAWVTFRIVVALEGGDFYEQLGIGWLAAIKPVKTFFERRRLSLTFAPDPEGIVPPADFRLPWYQMFIYGVFILVAGLQIAGFLVALIGVLLLGVDITSLANLVFIGSFFAAPVMLFGIGSWIGSYCVRYGAAVLFAIAVTARILTAVLDFLLIPEETFLPLVGQEKSILLLVQAMVVGIILFLLFTATVGLIGLWRGRRLRPARYLRFLLSKVGPEQRQTLIASMYEKVRPA
jgi:hypothetical protein